MEKFMNNGECIRRVEIKDSERIFEVTLQLER
jgi:hypothetical protein